MAVLSIDAGTTNVKALVVGRAGQVLARASQRLGVQALEGGRVEQDPVEVWTSVAAVVEQAASTASEPVDGLTISNQRESVLMWQRSTGRPVGPVLGWQDSRTSQWCREHAAEAAALGVGAITGLQFDAMFSASKMRWLLDHADGPASDLCVGTVDSWLVWQLTGGIVHQIEGGNASRTLLMGLESGDWDDRLLGLFGVPRDVLPVIVDSIGGDAVTRGVAGLADGTPVVAVLADSHAAMYAHHQQNASAVKATYGTGTSVMAVPGGIAVIDPADGISRTGAWRRDGRLSLALEGNIVSSGAALEWAAALLGLEVAGLLGLAGSVDSSGGVVFVPALAGLGAPHWNRSARASLTGMTAATTPAHVARAAVDAVAHQICDVVDAMRSLSEVAVLRADGGATASDLVMQRQADLLGVPVEVSPVAELSAWGAAMAGFTALGLEPPRLPEAERRFEPGTPDQAARHQWRAGVAAAQLPAG